MKGYSDTLMKLLILKERLPQVRSLLSTGSTGIKRKTVVCVTFNARIESIVAYTFL